MNNIRILKENFLFNIGKLIQEANKPASEQAKQFLKGVSDKITLDRFSKMITDLELVGNPANIYVATLLAQDKYKFISGITIDNFDNDLLIEIGDFVNKLYQLDKHGEKEEASKFLNKFITEYDISSDAANRELKGIGIDDKNIQDATTIVQTSLHDNNKFFEKYYNIYKPKFDATTAMTLALIQVIYKYDKAKLTGENYTNIAKFLAACRIVFADRNAQYSF